MAKSFWDGAANKAEKLHREIADQIKRGDAVWQKPWKPAEQPTLPPPFTPSQRNRIRAKLAEWRAIKKLKEETHG